MELYMKGILHRDVSIANILLGKKGDGSEPPPGFCGVLIDLHMAIKVGRDIAERSADWCNDEFGLR
jgi:serine/threonine protein kinase